MNQDFQALNMSEILRKKLQYSTPQNNIVEVARDLILHPMMTSL